MERTQFEHVSNLPRPCRPSKMIARSFFGFRSSSSKLLKLKMLSTVKGTGLQESHRDLMQTWLVGFFKIFPKAESLRYDCWRYKPHWIVTGTIKRNKRQILLWETALLSSPWLSLINQQTQCLLTACVQNSKFMHRVFCLKIDRRKKTKWLWVSFVHFLPAVPIITSWKPFVVSQWCTTWTGL